MAAACFAALHRRADRLCSEGALPVRWVAVARGTPPERLVARLSAGSYSVFLMVDDDLMRCETIDEGEALRKALAQRIGVGE